MLASKYDLPGAYLYSGYIMCSDGIYRGEGTYKDARKICSELGLKLWTPQKDLPALYGIAANITQTRQRQSIVNGPSFKLSQSFAIKASFGPTSSGPMVSMLQKVK